MDKEFLKKAKMHLREAKISLVYAAKEFGKTQGGFDHTIKEIKENIGDLEISITALEDAGV